MNLRPGMIAGSVLALLACGFGPAAAGSLVSIGLAGGVSVPVNDVASAFDDGIAGQGFVKFNIPFIVRLENGIGVCTTPFLYILCRMSLVRIL